MEDNSSEEDTLEHSLQKQNHKQKRRNRNPYAEFFNHACDNHENTLSNHYVCCSGVIDGGNHDAFPDPDPDPMVLSLKELFHIGIESIVKALT